MSIYRSHVNDIKGRIKLAIYFKHSFGVLKSFRDTRLYFGTHFVYVSIFSNEKGCGASRDVDGQLIDNEFH